MTRLLCLGVLGAAVSLAAPLSAAASPDAEMRAIDSDEAIRSESRRARSMAGVPDAPAEGPLRGALLPFPGTFGVFPAGTYDDAGQRLGSANLSVLASDDGLIEMALSSGVEGGAATRASAVLRRDDRGRGVRIVSERSESHDESGRSLGVMRIDHERGVGSCTPAGKTEADAETLLLPEDERVVNVPLNLLFLPLARGESQRVDFQYFLCRGGARLMDFRAKLARGPNRVGGKRLIEVSYGPELGAIGSWIAERMIPKLRFWYEVDDGDRGERYLAHRMPLFSKGPEVVIVRDGMAPSELLRAH